MNDRRRSDRLPKVVYVSWVGDNDPAFSFTEEAARRNLQIQVGFAAMLNPSVVGGRIVRYFIDPEIQEVP